ncbi:hypothetical protein GALMADRAFT_227861 [Galerina marginata CBS 339.88]|uniref:F-box domain-containing protein n=1 Tax=Galerina marginata (strain CBS 339.88) TaxID=685588 RepID=A0A067T598_GALM3|nr:hypothetical protein GALMADRAFT_227861 [Galerina marginata CBS 339.88]
MRPIVPPPPPPPLPFSIFRIRRNSFLGLLQPLPLELLELIFEFCHLQSLFHFLRLNRLAYNLVKRSLIYSTLTKHALDSLRVLSRTNTASYFTALHLLEVLSSRDCVHCGKPGFFLYLPECVRSCYTCVRVPEFETMQMADAVAAFGLTKRSMSKVPVSTTITRPGKRPSKLVSVRLARIAARVQHGGENSLAAYLTNPGPKKKQVYEARVSRWIARREFSHRQSALLSKVVIPFPHLDRTTGVAHTGVWCRACLISCLNLWESAPGRDAWQAGYTEDQFFRHVSQDCPGARKIWTEMQEM